MLIVMASLAMNAPAFSAEPQETVLITPLYAKETVLLDSNGAEVSRWKSEREGAGGARLLEGGRLLRLCRMPVADVFKKLEVRGGGLEILGKGGKSEWHFWNAVTRHISWGDALMLPNGNVLSLTLDWKSKDEAVALGRKTESVNESGMLFPGLMEIQPLENNRGRVVWEWHLYNHLEQTDTTAQGKAEGRVSIHEASKQKVSGWLNPANLGYDPVHDVVAFMVQGLPEVWLVDHSTTSQEAAGSSGGGYGRGGRLLVRYAVQTPATADGRKPLLRGYHLMNAEKQKPVRFLSRFVQNGSVHEEAVSIDSALQLSTAASSGSWKLPQGSPEVRTIPGYVEKTGDGHCVATHLLEGVVVKFDKDGKVLWRYDNAFGSRDIIASKEQAEACCGNGMPDISNPGPAGPKATKVAPVYRAMTSPFSN